MQFFVIFEKFTRAYLFQIALEIIWLPIQIEHDEQQHLNMGTFDQRYVCALELLEPTVLITFDLN